jgi:hypothetical protein
MNTFIYKLLIEFGLNSLLSVASLATNDFSASWAGFSQVCQLVEINK